VLTADLPAEGLTSGDVGTVVHAYRGGKAFEVEFVSLDGTTAAVVAVESSQLRSVRPHEIAHARVLAVA
jgi:hypothetical protein